MTDAVVLKNVYKSFGDSTILKDINACFASGQIHGIIGRNGSGKTVLLKCISGLTRYDRGEIAVNGSIVGKQVEIPDSLGILIENPGFLPFLSGLKNLNYLARLGGIADKNDVMRAIKLVGLDPSSKKQIRKYSLGMRQRLGLAQAIMEDPSLLVLDEPLSGLDKQGVKEMRELFMEFQHKGKTIIIASHDQSDIDILCETVSEIDNGIMRRIK